MSIFKIDAESTARHILAIILNVPLLIAKSILFPILLLIATCIDLIPSVMRLRLSGDLFLDTVLPDIHGLIDAYLACTEKIAISKKEQLWIELTRKDDKEEK